MQALMERKTTREFSGERLSPQALGVNRPEGPRGRPGRTAPSAMNLQEIDIYVALPEGVYLYEAGPNRLAPILARDVRAATNRNPAAGQASACLIFVEDTERRAVPPAGTPPPGVPPASAPGAGGAPAGGSPTAGEVDCGFIGQNVYLYCASEGLAAWFYSTDRQGLAKTLSLRPGQRVLYSQAVGHPARR